VISLVTLDEARAAAARIRGHVRRTPVIEWNGLALKLEYLQHGGSFKARGACNRLLAARADELGAGVVTASGGNHGLGVAYAAGRVGVPATVFLPDNAPASTERRLRAVGTRVERGGRAWDDAWARAAAHAAESGALLVHPFEDPEVIAGQATIGLELDEQLASIDVVVVAVGGGGLIAGVAAALRALRPSVRVIGVEPRGAPSMKDALAAGRLIELPEVKTIAGTLAPRAIGPRTLAHATALVEEVVLVEDQELFGAMRLLWDELRILVEPAGAATVAALQAGRVRLDGGRAVALVCGANLDADLAAAVVGGA
jgi:threonine dehydratase